jgi:hypothetical protein
MRITKEKLKKLLKTISAGEIPPDLSRETAQDALNKIKTLRGIIPICASCKKIRDDKGYWNQLESYIREHSEAVFSHGICPECTENLYPDLHPTSLADQSTE